MSGQGSDAVTTRLLTIRMKYDVFYMPLMRLQYPTDRFDRAGRALSKHLDVQATITILSMIGYYMLLSCLRSERSS